jgi:hypothetical protein
VIGTGGVTPPLRGWEARRAPVHWWLSAACAATGALPPLILALADASQDAGGAWVPGLRDIAALFRLVSAGLSPARAYFLDSAHLTLPALAGIPAWAWTAAGLATCGLPAAWGLCSALRSAKDRRLPALLALLLMIVPAALVFGYGALTARQVWAFKPFLGAAVLFYLWAGIGISSIRSCFVRWGQGATIVLLALASLVPYFTAWQKSTAAGAFHALPAQASSQGVIVEPLYQWPLAFYYLGSEVPVYGLAGGGASTPGGERTLYRLAPPRADEFGLRQEVGCQALPAGGDLYVYGAVERVRQASRYWPACVTDRKLWVYQDGAWMLLPGNR